MLVMSSTNEELIYVPLPVCLQFAQDAVPSQRDLCKRHSSHARETRFLEVPVEVRTPRAGPSLTPGFSDKSRMSDYFLSLRLHVNVDIDKGGREEGI